MWIDQNDCPEKWHEFKQASGGFIRAFHADGSECDEVEFYIPSNTDLERESTPLPCSKGD